MQRFCFGHIYRATEKIFQLLSQLDQSQQGLVCRQVDQQVKVAAVVFLSLGDGAINSQVGSAVAACHRKHIQPEVLQALADRGGGCTAHSPNPICSVWVGSVSPTCLALVMPLPEQAAGEGGQRRVEAHQLQALQLRLGRQQPIEGIPVGLPVATGVDAMMQLHGQRLETLLLQE